MYSIHKSEKNVKKIIVLDTHPVLWHTYPMIGQNIRHYRKKRKMTQETLASKIGVERSVLSRYETQSLDVTIDTVVRIAHSLNVKPITLMKGLK